jgi:hypothetical protein
MPPVGRPTRPAGADEQQDLVRRVGQGMEGLRQQGGRSGDEERSCLRGCDQEVRRERGEDDETLIGRRRRRGWP